MSPPSRRRGLKCRLSYRQRWKWASPPSRRRGLKSVGVSTVQQTVSCRLLRGGVDWNQTHGTGRGEVKHVASFAEAWIEIFFGMWTTCTNFRRLLRGGVDWNNHAHVRRIESQVASFAEAWIEILLSSSRLCRCIPSPPSRRRGLKFLWSVCIYNQPLSPPSRRRGLKSFPHPQKIKRKSRLLRGGVDWNGYPQYPQQYPQYVASFAEAWIEISLVRRK